MTGPDPAPTAEDVIAEAMRAHHDEQICFDHVPTSERHTWCCVCGEHDLQVTWFAHVSTAAVAAIRAMSVQQKAELIGGEVQRSGRTHLGASGLFEHEPVARLVGPWQAEP